MQFLIDLISQLWTGLIYLWDSLIGFFVNLINTLWQFAIDILPASLTDGSIFGVDLTVVDYIVGNQAQANFVTDASWIYFLFWFFPIVECLALFVLAWTIVGSIRLVRHLLGIVPLTNLG